MFHVPRSLIAPCHCCCKPLQALRARNSRTRVLQGARLLTVATRSLPRTAVSVAYCYCCMVAVWFCLLVQQSYVARGAVCCSIATRCWSAWDQGAWWALPAADFVPGSAWRAPAPVESGRGGIRVPCGDRVPICVPI